MARILVIDDEPGMREMIRDALEDEGHQIIEAADGEAGMTCYREQHPDLIVVDLLMPIKEGMATIHEMLRENRDVKIIAISGGGITRTDYLPLAEEMGAIRTFRKPFGMAEFIGAIEEAL